MGPPARLPSGAAAPESHSAPPGLGVALTGRSYKHGAPTELGPNCAGTSRESGSVSFSAFYTGLKPGANGRGGWDEHWNKALRIEPPPVGWRRRAH
jgi:hypothetical protein